MSWQPAGRRRPSRCSWRVVLQGWWHRAGLAKLLNCWRRLILSAVICCWKRPWIKRQLSKPGVLAEELLRLQLRLALQRGGDAERPRERLRRLASRVDDRLTLLELEQISPDWDPQRVQDLEDQLRSPRAAGGHASLGESDCIRSSCFQSFGHAMTSSRGPLLYEGKAKRIYASNNEAEVLVEFKNDATAFNAQKRAQLEDKGRLNCQISACLFELLEREGIPTHYCGLESDHWMVVQRVKVIPIEVVLRNVATGSLCRQTPISQGTRIGSGPAGSCTTRTMILVTLC